ncbi:hypothetical protein [Thalassotalea sp. G2M2-11]|uniref:hypothetical protein n=1 Tax=Thalassotalea sp. G2M2-11 TaxID=2787627 RepID=UPI0019D0F7AC|nr:hypothetical protein [Thalassotalea sp. G2M2-11]
MKYISLIFVTCLLAFSSKTLAVKIVGKELLEIYKLQGISINPTLPSIYVYDVINQAYLSTEDVVNYFKATAEKPLLDYEVSVLRHFAKPPKVQNIPLIDIKSVAPSVKSDSAYIVFFYNLGSETLEELDAPDFQLTEQRVKKILSTAKNSSGYLLLE